MQGKEFYTTKELAKKWEVKERTILELKDDAADPLPHYRFKGSIRFKFEDVKAYEERHRKPNQ